MEEQILAVDLSTEQTLEVNLPEQDNIAQIDVYWQDEVVLDLDASLMYIVSGQQEIQDYVDNKSKPEIDEYIQDYAKPIVSEVVDQIATPVIDEYFENTVKPSITEFAENEMAGYAATATTQAEIATEKANEASETAKIVDEKVQEFSQTIDASKTEFVNFAQEKTEEFEQTAITATEQAVGSAERSRIWAEGEQTEVEPLGGTLSSMGAADLAYAIANAPEDTPIDASGLFAMNVVKGEKGDKGDKGEDGKDGGGLEIGDVAFAVMGIDETKNLRRYLNGQVISQAQFVSFSNWVKERAKLYPNTVATEENWQAEVTNSKLGQCGKFVIDDTLGTIRLPKVVNVNGLQDLALMGSIKAESLPNISGNFTGGNNGGNDPLANGAFAPKGTSNEKLNGGDWVRTIINFNASRSSSTYQDNAPVQQEAIQYPYFIQVATGVEESVDVTREIELNNPFFLGMSQYFEGEPNNASWLISNGSFHSGAVYKSFYEWLLKIYNGTETVEGVSVKISTDTYGDYDYVINTADTTFRLPIYNGNEDKISNTVIVETWGSDFTLPYNAIVECAGYSESMSDDTKVSATIPDGITFTLWQHDNGYNVYTSPVLPKGTLIHSEGGKSYTYISYTVCEGNGSLYFYVGETIQDANVINASGVLTRVAELSNEYIVGLGMPDYGAGVSITSYTSSSNQFVAPCDGVLIFTLNISSSGVGIYIDDVLIALPSVASSAKLGNTYSFTISKGQKFYISPASFYTAYGINAFLPLKGAN